MVVALGFGLGCGVVVGQGFGVVAGLGSGFAVAVIFCLRCIEIFCIDSESLPPPVASYTFAEIVRWSWSNSRSSFIAYLTVGSVIELTIGLVFGVVLALHPLLQDFFAARYVDQTKWVVRGDPEKM